MVQACGGVTEVTVSEDTVKIGGGSVNGTRRRLAGDSEWNSAKMFLVVEEAKWKTRYVEIHGCRTKFGREGASAAIRTRFGSGDSDGKFRFGAITSEIA